MKKIGLADPVPIGGDSDPKSECCLGMTNPFALFSHDKNAQGVLPEGKKVGNCFRNILTLLESCLWSHIHSLPFALPAIIDHDTQNGGDISPTLLVFLWCGSGEGL